MLVVALTAFLLGFLAGNTRLYRLPQSGSIRLALIERDVLRDAVVADGKYGGQHLLLIATIRSVWADVRLSQQDL